MTGVADTAYAPVRKTVTVNTTVERAFQVFTEGFDTWWPRSHSIGGLPLEEAIIETKLGGRCYQRSTGGRECDWGQVQLWEPPHRFVIGWHLNAQWEYEPDAAKASEVEVTFTAQPDGSTRVDLEHRHFERQGADGAVIRSGVGSEGGWGSLLQMFADVTSR